MIDTHRVASDERTSEERKIEVRSVVTGFLFVRADLQGMYFFDRRINIEILMKWEEIAHLQEDITHGKAANMRITG